MKENQTVKPIIADDFSAVSFEVRGLDTLTLTMSKLHPDIIRRAACVGMAQVRIVDAAAIPAARKDGTIIPADERTAMKHAAMARLIEHYETGTDKWSRVSEAGPTGGYLFEALCEMYGHMKAPSEIRAYLDGLSDKEQSALREDDEVSPIIAKLKAAKLAAIPADQRVNTKGLLDTLKAPKAEDTAPDAPDAQ